MKHFGTMSAVADDFSIGGVSVARLKEEYGTPLYIIDEQLVRDQAELFRSTFRSSDFQTEVLYASKAFLNLKMAKLVHELGLSLDVVSGGEFYTALKAGFPPERVYFHGNNKLDDELILALEHGIGYIILDSLDEALRVEALMAERHPERLQKVLLRVNPGIEAHTHEYIKTSKNDSKFGESIYEASIFETLGQIAALPHLQFRGLHCHIGSQIFDGASLLTAADTMLDFYAEVKKRLGLIFPVLNLGGGFGVFYTEGDSPLDLKSFFASLTAHISERLQHYQLSLERVLIEPGRSLICNAGSTLYTVGGSKRTFSGKNYLFVDGGMTDNIRPALYQARYEACLANRALETPTKTYTVAGKLCESGDILIRDIELPEAKPGDLLLVASTGAYTYSMSSNYNRIGRPAVVFVRDGQTRLAVRRQSWEDLLAQDNL